MKGERASFRYPRQRENNICNLPRQMLFILCHEVER
jgi:hypothetical protein